MSPYPQGVRAKVKGVPPVCPLLFAHNLGKRAPYDRSSDWAVLRTYLSVCLSLSCYSESYFFSFFAPEPSSVLVQSRCSVSVRMKVSFRYHLFMTIFARCWVEGRAWFNQDVAILKERVTSQGDNSMLELRGRISVFIPFWKWMFWKLFTATGQLSSVYAGTAKRPMSKPGFSSQKTMNVFK